MTKDKTKGDGAPSFDMLLQGLFGQLGTTLSEAISRLDDRAEVRHEATFDSPHGPLRASTGIRISTLPTGRPPQRAAHRAARPVNPDRAPADPQPTPPDTLPVRAITATILTEGGLWRLIAELPGISDSDVTLAEVAGELSITARTARRSYGGRFALPPGATAAALGRTMQNGILELTWQAPE